MDNFKNLDYFERELIAYPTIYNSLEFLNKFNKKEDFEWPEKEDTIIERVNYVNESVQKFALEHPELVVVWISHGFVTETLRIQNEIEPGFYHYGSVNRWDLNEIEKKFKLAEIDAKYY